LLPLLLLLPPGVFSAFFVHPLAWLRAAASAVFSVSSSALTLRVPFLCLLLLDFALSVFPMCCSAHPLSFAFRVLFTVPALSTCITSLVSTSHPVVFCYFISFVVLLCVDPSV
jgi:hypothetical protein